MKELKCITSAFYGFSGGCLLAAALSFFETCELSFTLFIFAATAFLIAETLDSVVRPLYASALRRRIEAERTDSPTIIITGFGGKERLK